jgi:hypothetical protein
MAKDSRARSAPAIQGPEWHSARTSKRFALESACVLAVLVDIVHGNLNVLRHCMLAETIETSALHAVKHCTLGRRDLRARCARNHGNVSGPAWAFSSNLRVTKAAMLSIPSRAGARPLTTRENPHKQLDQNPPPDMIAKLAKRCFSFAGVVERPSLVSVRGARALCVAESLGTGPRAAFLIGREFAHIHPPPDGSMHLALSPKDAHEIIEKGWGEQHPVARVGYLPPGIMMVYAPRDDRELEVVLHIVQAAFRFASGDAQLPA